MPFVRCARQSTPWAAAEVMIDEVSTASGSDRVIDEVTARICPLHTLAAMPVGSSEINVL